MISIVNLAETLSKNSLTNQEESKSVICAALKKDYHGKVVPVQMMTFWEIDDSLHLAEEQLKNLHKFILKYVGSLKIPARQQTATLFATNIRYHKSCDQAFRASSWKKLISLMNLVM